MGTTERKACTVDDVTPHRDYIRYCRQLSMSVITWLGRSGSREPSPINRPINGRDSPIDDHRSATMIADAKSHSPTFPAMYARACTHYFSRARSDTAAARYRGIIVRVIVTLDRGRKASHRRNYAYGCAFARSLNRAAMTRALAKFRGGREGGRTCADYVALPHDISLSFSQSTSTFSFFFHSFPRTTRVARAVATRFNIRNKGRQQASLIYA